MISVIIPTHKKDTSFLRETIISVENQTYSDWQIVLVPNNEGLEAGLSEWQNNPKIKTVPCYEKTNRIGQIKKFAFPQGDGEWLLELDHDDILLPTALEELAKVPSGYDFAYSNNARFNNDWSKPLKYNEAYGWKHREIDYQGHKLDEAISWEPTPQALSLIYYAPDHFRAWRKEFYERIGGHNPDYEACDDHELLIRTYLAGKMYHIDECLYLYRVHGQNEWLLKNQKIQDLTYQLHDQYIYQLVEGWCDLEGLRKIDLCGGFSKPAGYESVDLENGDIRADLNEKWPFKDNSIGLFRAHDALEHLKDPIHVMKEAYRCLVPGGWFLTMTPSTDGRGAFQDPTHISFWNSNSFWYYTREEQGKYIGKPTKFQLTRVKNFYPNSWCETHNIVYVKADLFKPGKERLPGLMEI